jgi:hypothetical protein
MWILQLSGFGSVRSFWIFRGLLVRPSLARSGGASLPAALEEAWRHRGERHLRSAITRAPTRHRTPAAERWGPGGPGASYAATNICFVVEVISRWRRGGGAVYKNGFRMRGSHPGARRKIFHCFRTGARTAGRTLSTTDPRIRPKAFSAARKSIVGVGAAGTFRAGMF